MPSPTLCPHCQSQLNGKDDSIYGKQLKCPKCGNLFVAARPQEAEEVVELNENDLVVESMPSGLSALEPLSNEMPMAPNNQFANSPQAMQMQEPVATFSAPPPNQSLPKPKKKLRGEDGLTDKERRFNKTVQIVGIALILITLGFLAYSSTLLHEAWDLHPVVYRTIGSIPVFLIAGFFIAYKGAHGKKAKETRKLLLGHAIGSGIVFIAASAIIFLPDTVILPVTPILIGFGAGLMYFLISIGGLFTGHNYIVVIRQKNKKSKES